MATVSNNKQQRLGKSYLHNIVRDARKPYSFRGSVRRLLNFSTYHTVKNGKVYHLVNRHKLRPTLSRNKLPVRFKYLSPNFYSHKNLTAKLFSRSTNQKTMHSPSAQYRHSTSVNKAPINTAQADSERATDKLASLSELVLESPKVALDTVGYEPQDVNAHIKYNKTENNKLTLNNNVNVENITIPEFDLSPLSNESSQTSSLAIEHKNKVCDVNDLKSAVTAYAKHIQKMPKKMSLDRLAKQLEKSNYGDNDNANNSIKKRLLTQKNELNVDKAIKYPEVLNKDVTIFSHKEKSYLDKILKISVKNNAVKSQSNDEVFDVQHHHKESLYAEKLPAIKHMDIRQQAEPLQKLDQPSSKNKQQAPARKSMKRSKRVVSPRRAKTAAFWERSHLPRIALRMYR